MQLLSLGADVHLRNKNGRSGTCMFVSVGLTD